MKLLSWNTTAVLVALAALIGRTFTEMVVDLTSTMPPTGEIDRAECRLRLIASWILDPLAVAWRAQIDCQSTIHLIERLLCRQVFHFRS